MKGKAIMASITRQPNGRRMIQFKGPDGKRRSIRLGKVSQRTAQAVKVHVERLAEGAMTGHAIPDDTARWLFQLGDVMHDKLSAVALVPKRERATVGAFAESYIQSRTDVKESTRLIYGQVKKNLVDFFGADKSLREVTPGDADGFRLWLLSKAGELVDGFSESTASRRVRYARQFFRAAVRKRLISENPFEGVEAGQQVNEDRFYFVSVEEAERIASEVSDEGFIHTHIEKHTIEIFVIRSKAKENMKKHWGLSRLSFSSW